MTYPYTPGPWYESVTGNHQGLIISEANGANVAVTYDRADAALIVRAVNLHDELVDALTELAMMAANFPTELHSTHPDVVAARAVLAKLPKEES